MGQSISETEAVLLSDKSALQHRTHETDSIPSTSRWPESFINVYHPQGGAKHLRQSTWLSAKEVNANASPLPLPVDRFMSNRLFFVNWRTLHITPIPSDLAASHE